MASTGHSQPSKDFPGWMADEFGTLTLSVEIAGKPITLATVAYDAGSGLYETFIGRRLTENQLGRIDSSQERAVRKAEDFLREKLSRLL